MTVIYGIVREEYAILGADTRVTYFPPGAEPFYKDDANKIVYFRGGWSAGAGSSDFIKSFNNAMLVNKISQVDQIETLYRVLLGNHKPVTDKEHELFQNTRLAYIYPFHNEKAQLEMHLESLYLTSRTGVSGKDTFISFGQGESPVEVAAKEKAECELKDVISLSQSIVMCAAFVKEVATVNPFVSSICDIGILLKKSNTRIDCYRIRRLADEIINGEISSLWCHVDTLGG